MGMGWWHDVCRIYAGSGSSLRLLCAVETRGRDVLVGIWIPGAARSDGRCVVCDDRGGIRLLQGGFVELSAGIGGFLEWWRGRCAGGVSFRSRRVGFVKRDGSDGYEVVGREGKA